MKEKSVPIDFIITWVDNNDITWLEEKQKYLDEMEQTNLSKWNVGDIRYRDWGLLRYWFRGVEKFAPWVRKIYFVTCGHIPDWLNVEHTKLHIVNHEDYIPKEFLPTFNSHCIELNFHRIEGLSEQFVYFNDDMFLIKDVRPKDFFRNGLPCDTAILTPIYLKQNGIRAEINDLYVINECFEKISVIKKDFFKWFSLKYGINLVKTLLLLPFHYFTGFYITHMPNAYLKTTYEEVWKKVPQILIESCEHRFRETTDVNQWLLEYWQFVKGDFYPRNPNIGMMYEGKSSLSKMCKDIEEQKYKMICCNDAIDIDDFEKVKKDIKKAFDSILGEKSSFERE